LQVPRAALPAPHQLFDFAVAALERFAGTQNPIIDGPAARARNFTVHPRLVWRLSRQSSSPFYPFVQINVAGTILYATWTATFTRNSTITRLPRVNRHRAHLKHASAGTRFSWAGHAGGSARFKRFARTAHGARGNHDGLQPKR
jgi:hypothetical protein